MAYRFVKEKIGRIMLAGTIAASMAMTTVGTAGLWTVAAAEISSSAEETADTVSTGETIAEDKNAAGDITVAEETAEAGDNTAAGINTAAEETAAAGDNTAAEENNTQTDSQTTYEDSSDGGHAIEADGEKVSYNGITVIKTGEAEGDEADFYGENAAIFATNGATLDLTDSMIQTDGTHANGVFSYGEGTTVNVSDTTIDTSGNCSGGLMTTGGGTMNAENLTIHTTGNSSAAIRSDRGGGTVNVTGGTYTTDGVGSPVIYSTADITVSDADLTSTSSQGVVVEGKNSVTLLNTDLTADNTSKNSDKSDWYQAVMIYQSMSGDAAEGEASFAMDGGSLTNKNGDIFFVNNTVATIALSDVEITNEDEEGVFLRAAAAGWGNEGSNGGHVTLQAQDQVIEGDLLVDEVSSLNLYLRGDSALEGAVNPDGDAGEVYVELDDSVVWTLTGDSYITALTCDADAIDLNGYTLCVNGEVYEEGSESSGEAIEVEVTSGGKGDRPDGDGQGGPGQDGNGRPGEGGPGQDGNGRLGEGDPGQDGKGGPGEGGPGADGNPPEPPEGVDGERPELPEEVNGNSTESE